MFLPAGSRLDQEDTRPQSWMERLRLSIEGYKSVHLAQGLFELSMGHTATPLASTGRPAPRIGRAACVLVPWMLFSVSIEHAEPIRFNAYDLENQQAAAWAPQEVMVHRNDVADEQVIFILNNPPERTHAFEPPGLLEQTSDQDGAPLTKLLRVTVAPGEPLEIVIRSR